MTFIEDSYLDLKVSIFSFSIFISLNISFYIFVDMISNVHIFFHHDPKSTWKGKRTKFSNFFLGRSVSTVSLGTCIHPRDNTGARWWLRGSISKKIAEEIILLLKEMTQVFRAVYQQQNVLFPVNAWFPSWFILGLTKFPIKIQKTQLGTCEPNLEYSRCFTKVPNQNLIQIGPGVHYLWSDIQTNKQADKLRFLLYIYKDNIYWLLLFLYFDFVFYLKGKFSEDWTNVSKSGIAEAVLNLTRLEAEQRHPEDGLRCGTLWLATAALTVLHR